jgi:hypothetical protein
VFWPQRPDTTQVAEPQDPSWTRTVDQVKSEHRWVRGKLDVVTGRLITDSAATGANHTSGCQLFGGTTPSKNLAQGSCGSNVGGALHDPV